MPNQVQFEPLHSAHAIEQVALVVQFQKMLDAQALRAVKNAIGSPSDLPAKAELRGFTVPVGPSAGPGGQFVAGGAAPLTGFAYTRMRPDGTEEAEFQAQRHQIAFRTLLYTRWADVFAQAQKLFNAVLPIYLQHSPLGAVGLNYVDKFVCDAQPTECSPLSLLRKDSPYLAPRIFETRDLWHCHTGTFSRPDERTKRLISVNVDLVTDKVEEKDRTLLAITSILTDGFNQAGYEPTELTPNTLPGFVYQRFEALHGLDKEVLRSIITPTVAQRIALEKTA